MPLPHVVARVNKRVTNRFIEPVARLSPGFGVVHHTGRVSGARYATPLNFFDLAGDVLVVLTYGPGVDWLRNVSSGPAELERGGVRSRIDRLRVVGRERAWPTLPWFVRLAVRLLRVRDFAVLTTSTPPSRPIPS